MVRSMKSQRKPRAVQQDVTFLTDQFKKKSSAYEAIISPTTKVEMKTQDSFVRNSAWPPGRNNRLRCIKSHDNNDNVYFL